MHETVLPRIVDSQKAGTLAKATGVDAAGWKAEPTKAHRGRVTQIDAARAAGVHNTTVSLALRNRPSIPLATRQRIQSLAQAMGYCPDPALQALASYRKVRAVSQQLETVAYITNFPSCWGWQRISADAQYYLGAQRRAMELGYELEHFWLSEAGMNPRRLNQILYTRRINSVILASHRVGAAAPLDFDWDLFSAVKIGNVPGVPAFHTVTNDRQGSVRLAVSEALGAGYRRPGLVLPMRRDTDVNKAWSLGFITEQLRWSLSPRIPVFHHEFDDIESWNTAGSPKKAQILGDLAAWFAKFRPDVILGFRPFTAELLSSLKLQIPDDIGFIDLFNEGDDLGVAGVRQNCEYTGAVAVDQLMGQLWQNLRGIPQRALMTYVSGTWRDGASLPRCNLHNSHEYTVAGHASVSA